MKAVLGCINNETSHFLQQEADGILGLSPQRESNFLETLYEAHHNLTQEKLSFSICLALDGGMFSLGNLNTALHGSPPYTIKLRENGKSTLLDNLNSMFGLSQTKFYSLDLEQVYVGSRSLGFSHQDFQGDGMFIDSGATYSYLPSRQHKVAIEELDKVCEELNCTIAKGESVRCYHMSKDIELNDQVERFPNISIAVPGKSERLHWSPWSYLMVRNDKEREICVGLEALNRMILGNNWMTDRDI